MVTESLATALPRVLLPYAQQWAQRSGNDLLRKLLADEQLAGLIAKYGDELIKRFAQAAPAPEDPARRPNRHGRPERAALRVVRGESGDDGLSELHRRVATMEAQQAAQQADFDEQQLHLNVFRSKLRPLALALGACPECLVGLAECQVCLGEGGVGSNKPDPQLLNDMIIAPLVERGVPLALNVVTVPQGGRRSARSSATRKRSET